MPYFSVKAVYAKTMKPVKVEFFLGGVSRGFTPDRENESLDFSTSSSGEYSWYARKGGNKIQEGESDGGAIKVIVY